MKTLTPLVAALALAGGTLPAQAEIDDTMAVAWNQSGSHWQTIDTEHFHIHFDAQHQQQARRAATIAEQAWQALTPRIGWQPAERIHMVLTDDHDMANGWADVEPFNQIRVFLSPPDGYSTLEHYDDWLNLLITHELTHVLHVDMAFGIPAAVRSVFGRNVLTFPHAFTPGFLIEGLAVYTETDLAAGFGRGDSTLYDMMMRAEVMNGIDDLSEISTPLRDLPGGKHYLYGYYYWAFLAETYGEDKVREYLQQYARNIIPFFMQHSEARKVFGKSHNRLWLEFGDWLQARFQPQIDRLQQQPESAMTLISSAPTARTTASASDGRYYYFLQDNGDDRRSLMKTDPLNGETSELLSLTGIRDIDVAGTGQIIYTRYVVSSSGQTHSDLFTVIDGEEQRLTEGGRYRSARWLTRPGQPAQLIASQIIAGISSLHLLDAQGNHLRTLWQGDAGDVLGDFSLSAAGDKLVASLKRPQSSWNLEIMSLQKPNHWQAITQTAAMEHSAHFVDNDQSLLFSADYREASDGNDDNAAKAFNIYRLSLSNGEVTPMTHTLTTLTQPLEINGQLMAQHYRDGGYQHVQVKAQQEAAFNIHSTTPAPRYPDHYQPLAETSTARDYNALDSMMPTQWFPLFSVSEDYNTLGLTFSGADALRRHNYDMSLSADTQNDLLNFSINYHYDNRWQVMLLREHNYYENDDDELTMIRRHCIAEISRHHIITAMEDMLSLSAGLHRDEEQSVAGDGLDSSGPHTRKAVAGLRLDFDNMEAYRNSFSPSWGSTATLLFESNDLIDSDYSGNIVLANVSHFIDLPGNQVLAVHVAAARGGDETDPFELGGTMSESEQPLFGRDQWGLRGYDEATQVGSRVQVNSLEYRFPLINIERGWGMMPIGIAGFSATVFSDYGAAWNQGDDIDYLASAGVELNAELVVLYGHRLPLRVGYAYGLDKDKGDEHTYASIGFQF